MLYRLTLFFDRRFPLPVGTGRWGVVSAAALLTAAAWLGMGGLSIGGLSALFDADDPGEKRFAEYARRFDPGHEVVVLIDTGEQGEHMVAAESAAFALGESLEEERRVAAVRWGFNPFAVSPKLIRMLPVDELEEKTKRIAQIRMLLVSDTPAALLQAGMAEALRSAVDVEAETPSEGESLLSEGAAIFAGVMESFSQRMRTPADTPMDLWAAMQNATEESSWQLLRSDNGRLLVMRVELIEGIGGEPGYGGSLEALRRQVEAVRLRFDGLELGITGYEATRREAEQTLRHAMIRGVVGALLGLLLLTGFAWRSLWLPVVVVVLPGLASLWTLGLIGWGFGAANGLSMFGVVAAGAVALSGGLMLAGVWVRGDSRRSAVVAAGPVLVGIGVFVALVGGILVVGGDRSLTVLSVASNGDTLVGLRQAGAALILGVLMAWFVVLGVGPALLLGKRNGPHGVARGEMAWALADAAGRRPRVAWAGAGLMLLVVVVMAIRTPRTVDPSGFLPAEVEGAVWQKRAMTHGGESSMPLMCVAHGMNEARAWTDRLRDLPEVGAVTGIGRLIPEDHEAKAAVMAALNGRIGDAARAAAARPESTSSGDTRAGVSAGAALIDQVRLIRAGLDYLPASIQAKLGELDRSMKDAADSFISEVEALEPEVRAERLAALRSDYEKTQRQVGRFIADMVDPTPLSLNDLAMGGGLFDPWIATPQRSLTNKEHTPVLLCVYPAAGASGWLTTQELAAFHQAVRGVDPNVTGTLERLQERGRTVEAAVVELSVAMAILWVVVAGGLGVTWRSAIGGGVGVLASAMVLWAGVGVLSEPMVSMGWGVWPVVGLIVVTWAMGCAMTNGTPADVESNTLRRAAVGEAFGLILATGFIVAAGLRSAGAPGLTATAVAACLAVGLAGLWVLLLVSKPQEAAGTTQHEA